MSVERDPKIQQTLDEMAEEDREVARNERALKGLPETLLVPVGLVVHAPDGGHRVRLEALRDDDAWKGASVTLRADVVERLTARFQLRRVLIAAALGKLASSGRWVDPPTDVVDDPAVDWALAFPTLADGAVPHDQQTTPLARMLAWPEHVAIVRGRAGSGKSRLLAAAAGAVTRGATWLGMDTGEPGRVLWLAFEDLAGARALLRQHGSVPDMVHVGDGSLLTSGDWAKHLGKVLDVIRPAWVIVDSLASLSAAANIDSNNADEVTRLLEPLARAARAGAAVTVTHHQPHQEERLRNSSAIGASADAIIAATMVDATRTTTLKRGEKVRFGLQHDRVVHAKLSDDGRTFSLISDETPTSGDADAVEKICDYLKKHPELTQSKFVRHDARQVLGLAANNVQLGTWFKRARVVVLAGDPGPEHGGQDHPDHLIPESDPSTDPVGGISADQVIPGTDPADPDLKGDQLSGISPDGDPGSWIGDHLATIKANEQTEDEVTHEERYRVIDDIRDRLQGHPLGLSAAVKVWADAEGVTTPLGELLRGQVPPDFLAAWKARSAEMAESAAGQLGDWFDERQQQVH